MDTNMLTDQRRSQLDGIVQKMAQNKEPDGNIQFVVDDFKKKYEHEMDMQQNNQPTAPQGFLSKVKEAATSRISEVKKLLPGGEYSKDQSPIESVGQYVGQGAGFLGDVATEAFLAAGRAVLPKVAEDAISGGVKKAVTKIASIPVVQKGVEEYGKFKESNPALARDIAAAGNIASLLPIGEGAGVGTKAAQKVAGKAATTLEKSAARSVESEAKSFVRELVRPTLTKAQKEAEVVRTTEKGSSLFRRSVVAPSFEEKRAMDAVLTIPEVSPRKTFQQNYNIIREANTKEAKTLESELKKYDFAFDKSKLEGEFAAARSRLASNPALTGDAEATAEKLITKVESLVSEKSAIGSNLLEIRKNLDDFVRSQKGDAAFDPAKENAFSIANREIRNTLNSFLDRQAEIMGVPKSVRDSLTKQSSLYTALDTIAPKAAQEANTAIVRAFQNMAKAVGLKNRLVQEIAAVAGLGGLGAAAIFAPVAATISVGGFLTYRAGKFILKPEIRSGLSRILRAFARAGKPTTPEIRFLENLVDNPESDALEVGARLRLEAPKSPAITKENGVTKIGSGPTIYGQPYKGSESGFNPRASESFAAERQSIENQNSRDVFNFSREQDVAAAKELRGLIITGEKRSDLDKLVARFKSKDSWLRFANSNPMLVKKISTITNGMSADSFWDRTILKK